MDTHEKAENMSDPKDGFRNQLLSFSQGISLEWLSHNKESIQSTPELQRLIELFPPLEETFRNWTESDQGEFLRTVIHTFQAQAAFNHVCAESFPESGLGEEVIKKVNDLGVSISSFSTAVMPIILWLHDIGRCEDKEKHTEKSAEMISSLGFLNNKGLLEEEIILIRKVVQYHLLIGTLYTGESSYLSFYPLLKDEEFKIILQDHSLISRFLDSLTLFTIIDVWGYHINDISPTMIDNYLDIRKEMEGIFSAKNSAEEIKKRLKKRSRRHLEWRLMGYMMAFSKMGKKPYLTRSFYMDMILNGYGKYKEREQIPLEWNEFKDRCLNKIDQVQFKYGLGVLIPLSYGGTGEKMHLTEDTQVNPNLFQLLVCINNRIQEEESSPQCIPEAIWNVVFKGYPFWNRKTDFHQRLNEPGQIEEIVNRGQVTFDKKEGINTLSIDYGDYWDDLDD